MGEKERLYLTMRNTGVINMVIGITILSAGTAAGVLLLVSGVKLLRRKKSITF